MGLLGRAPLPVRYGVEHQRPVLDHLVAVRSLEIVVRPVAAVAFLRPPPVTQSDMPGGHVWDDGSPEKSGMSSSSRFLSLRSSASLMVCGLDGSGVTMGRGVGVAVGRGVGVAVGRGVAISVGSGVAVGMGVAVAGGFGAGVAVGVGEGRGVGAAAVIVADMSLRSCSASAVAAAAATALAVASRSGSSSWEQAARVAARRSSRQRYLMNIGVSTG